MSPGNKTYSEMSDSGVAKAFKSSQIERPKDFRLFMTFGRSAMLLKLCSIEAAPASSAKVDVIVEARRFKLAISEP